MNSPRITTLVVPHTGTHVLLGMKKRGFGEGRWNGFGGKVHEGESVEDAARREFFEETGCDSEELVSAGTLVFTFEDKAEEPIEMHLFRIRDFTGEPQETEEMRPRWFPITEIPYGDMWPDDSYWLPKFLKGEDIRGRCHFRDFNTVLHFSFDE